MLMRARNTSTASQAVGISGTSISSTLDGRWVKTMVFNRPMRAAIHPAARNESAESRPAQKKTTPSHSVESPQRTLNQ